MNFEERAHNIRRINEMLSNEIHLLNLKNDDIIDVCLVSLVYKFLIIVGCSYF